MPPRLRRPLTQLAAGHSNDVGGGDAAVQRAGLQAEAVGWLPGPAYSRQSMFWLCARRGPHGVQRWLPESAPTCSMPCRASPAWDPPPRSRPSRHLPGTCPPPAGGSRTSPPATSAAPRWPRQQPAAPPAGEGPRSRRSASAGSWQLVPPRAGPTPVLRELPTALPQGRPTPTVGTVPVPAHPSTHPRSQVAAFLLPGAVRLHPQQSAWQCPHAPPGHGR